MDEEMSENNQETSEEVVAPETKNPWKDLDLGSIQGEEILSKVLQEKMGFSIENLKDSLSAWVLKNAEELTLELTNIAPLGDYGRLLEDNDSMATFLKEEAHKSEHWKLHEISNAELAGAPAMRFFFKNTSVDEGEVLEGIAYVSYKGKIRHAFGRINE